MAVQMPLIGLLIAHRLVRICASGQTQHRHRNILLRLIQSKKEIKTFSTSCRKYNENEKDSSDPPPLKTQMTSRQALLSRRRRPLSPLERISHMLPQDTLSPEVMQLREQSQQEPEEETHIQKFTQSAGEESKHEASDVNSSETQLNDDKEEDISTPPTLPGERLYGFGELLLAEYRKKLRVEFRKMFQLAKGMRLQSQWGIILHDDIAGQPSGGSLKTNNRVPIFIRRPSLDEYVLYMKRGPAISYPKVCVVSD